jgi:protein gp37
MYRDSFNGTRYNPREVIRTKTVFDLPLRLKVPSMIFTCSLTDFFLEEIDSYRQEAWDIIRKCKHHTFQILTKRPERISECLPDDWNFTDYSHVWIGTSVGSMDGIDRLWSLAKNPHLERHIKFLSIEPLHQMVTLPEEPHSNTLFQIQDLIDWVIVGGESGNETGKYRYRECKVEWIESIVNYCTRHKIPVTVKQLGTHLSKKLGLKDRHGGNIDEFPEHLRIRQFPLTPA